MERFFKEFETERTKDAWMGEVLKDLKGKPYEKIIWNTYENIPLEPYYKEMELEGISIPDEIPGEFPFVRSNKPVAEANNWKIIQEISNDDPSQAVEMIKESLAKGAEGIDLLLNCRITSGKNRCCCSITQARGVVLNSQDELKNIFDSIDPGKSDINIIAGVASEEVFDLLEQHTDSNKNIKGSIDNDPLKEFALRGTFTPSETERFREMKTVFDKCLNYPDFKGVKISNEHFHEAGATIVQKIAYLLSTAVIYKEKIAQDISFSEFVDNISLSYAVGQNYLLEIAGLRALRMLWSNLVMSYGAEKETKPVCIHAKTSIFNKTLYDPYVNILRTTTEAMSAIIGGCNSLTVLPFNICYDDPDPFSLRIARNTQLVLKEEAHFDKFVDPASGSYYIEKATHEIAKKAWSLFQELEKEGGIIESLRRGDIQSELEDLKERRKENFRRRKDNLVGTNHVPDYQEVSNSRFKSIRQQKLDIFGEFSKLECKEPEIARVKPFRVSEEFELYRKLTEDHNNKIGKKITAFLATVGNLTMRKARASFSMGLLSAGGFNIIDNNGFATADEVVTEFFETGANIIVICSSDEEYAGVGVEIAKKVKEKDCNKVIVLAGYPKDILEDLKKAGVDEFIHMRSDSIETIKNIQKKLGIHS